MVDSIRRWSFFNSADRLVEKISSWVDKFRCWKKKKRKPRKLDFDFSWLTTSSAAMELSNQLKMVFEFIDANGDGKISPLELSEVLYCLGQEEQMANREAEEMVKQMDCDGDGLVDLDEFMSIMDSDPSGRAGGDRNLQEDDDELRRVFLVFDADKNGFISVRELRHVLTRLGCRNCSLKQCRRMIKGVDKDGDGLVNFEEFKSMMTAGYNKVK